MRNSAPMLRPFARRSPARCAAARLFLGVGLLCIGTWVVGCASSPPRDDRLYRDLGATDGITAIVEGLLFRLVDNPRIGHLFAETDIVNLRDRLVEQFCVEAGGPCTYGGLSMEDAHLGLDIDQAAFNALVEDLQLAMEDLDVPISAQNRLLARLAPMRRDILHR